MNVKPGDASTSGERPDLVSSSEYQDFFGDGSTYGLHDVYLACGVLKQVQHDIGGLNRCHPPFRISRNFTTQDDML